MRKVFLLMAIGFASVFCSGEVTNTQVANFILQNHNCNLNDPNKIYPGQWLPFNFDKKDMAFVQVRQGDYLNRIAKKILIQHENRLKQHVLSNYSVSGTKKLFVQERKTPDKGCPWNTIPVWCWVGVSFLLFVTSLDFFIDDQKQKKNKTE